jgi:hypothetical protein
LTQINHYLGPAQPGGTHALHQKIVDRTAHLATGWLRRISGSRHHFQMSATVIEFRSARGSGSKAAHNTDSVQVSNEDTAPLTDVEIAAIQSLRASFQTGGSEAFNVAAKRQLFILASLIKRVLGDNRLNELLAAAERV